ncbi:hypothetical protein F5148DRAFT_1152359 [Russula earlei]|uniref:Uncharacterized protein n=1 Tax=Russula earlei TaxID=71964 RepID=A0ACC0TWQ4_9AGAM|nr:hypothetical protein F5148DRAFT_1152359 [Russula earlei]
MVLALMASPVATSWWWSLIFLQGSVVASVSLRWQHALQFPVICVFFLAVQGSMTARDGSERAVWSGGGGIGGKSEFIDRDIDGEDLRRRAKGKTAGGKAKDGDMDGTGCETGDVRAVAAAGMTGPEMGDVEAAVVGGDAGDTADMTLREMVRCRAEMTVGMAGIIMEGGGGTVGKAGRAGAWANVVMMGDTGHAGMAGMMGMGVGDVELMVGNAGLKVRAGSDEGEREDSSRGTHGAVFET